MLNEKTKEQEFQEHINLVSFVHAQKVLNEALEKLYEVEIRLLNENVYVEREKLKLKAVYFNEERNHVAISSTDNLTVEFDFNTCEEGTSSKMHEKLYFRNDNMTLSITIKK